MADQYQNNSTASGNNLRMQKMPVPDATGRGMNPDIHTQKNSTEGSFVPPPMETITGKRIMQEAAGRSHTQAKTPTQYPDMRMQKSSGFNTFVPSSMEMITGESVMPMDTPAMPLAPSPSDAPESVQNPYYAAGFLKNYIGREMRVQFLIGANGALVDRTGTLMEVGASFIVLRPTETDDLLMCDLFSIKFVTIYR